jgi:hypothetical protein
MQRLSLGFNAFLFLLKRGFKYISFRLNLIEYMYFGVLNFLPNYTHTHR